MYLPLFTLMGKLADKISSLRDNLLWKENN